MTLRGTVPAGRAAAWILTVLVVAVAALFAGPSVRPAVAACGVADPAACVSSSDSSSTSSVADCLDPPTPAMPDTGASSFFLKEPTTARSSGVVESAGSLTYYQYGYAGLQYHTYDLGCGPDGAVAPDSVVNTSVANMMLGVSTFIVGLTNSIREHAFDPKQMWGWTDALVSRASEALYSRLFTTLGVVSVVIVGAWLMWSARRGDLSDAATTAGWALLVLIVTTAIAAWPVRAASVADGALTGSLSTVNNALHPASSVSDVPTNERASGIVTDTVLYRQWVSGELGSADSKTAHDYGGKLYADSTFTWKEAAEIRANPTLRASYTTKKQDNWKRDAAEIEKTDPDAYEYLTGKQGTARIGASFAALVSAAVVAPFDLMSSILIIIAFLIIRLAVVFLPAIAVVGILRPASAPLRGLFRTVVAAIINCVIFGVGASVYLLALELITSTTSLAGWQQILLIFLTGLVMWMLLRPFRRLTSLAGGNPFHDMVGGLSAFRRRAVDGALVVAGAAAGKKIADEEGASASNDRREGGRPESWTRERTVPRVPDEPPAPSRSTRVPESSPVSSGAGSGSRDPVPVRDRAPQRVSASGGGRPETGGGVDYRDPSYPVTTHGEVLPVESDQSFVIYRPDSGYRTVEPDVRPENRATASRDFDDAPVGN